jgi:vacuolar-type H+-ATPase subunit H
MNSNILSLLDMLQAEIENAPAVAFSKNTRKIDVEKIEDILRQIRANLPEDIKTAEIVNKERKRILMDAEREASRLIDNAAMKSRMLVSEHEIIKEAAASAHKLLADAQENAREVRLAANDYADELFSELEEYMASHMDLIRENRMVLKRSHSE